MKKSAPESGYLLVDEDTKVNVDAKYAKWIKLINEIEGLARETQHCIETDGNDSLSAILFSRIISNVAASVVVIQCGYKTQGSALLRTALESMFILIAIEKDQKIIEQFNQNGVLEYKKILNKYKDVSDPILKAVFKLCIVDKRRAKIKEIDSKSKEAASKSKEAASKSKEAANGKNMSIWKYAEDADLLDWYRSVYSIFSASVHGSVWDLESHLDLDDEGKITQIRNEPDLEGLDVLFFTGSKILLMSLDSISKTFKLGVSEWHTQIQNRLETLTKLMLTRADGFR